MSADKETLTALLERVRAATGPDLELDFLIYSALRPRVDFDAFTKIHETDPIAYWFWMSRGIYTASVDAALALTERVLGNQWFGVLLDAMRELGGAGVEPPSKLPRYIIAATLTALIAQAETP